MKKIILSLALSVVAVATFAQHPIGSDSFNLQTVANSLGLFKSKGAIASDSGFVNASYPDTTAANLGNRLKNYPGAQIRVGNSIWMRNSTATAWIEQGAGGGSSGIHAVYAGNCLTQVNDSTLELDLSCLAAQDTIFSFHTDSVVVNKKLRIPLTDTTNAKKGCGNIIYDTINEHYYGDVCINGAHNHWGCFDCEGLTSVAWGDITGTLSDQTDLQTALNTKLQTAGDLSPLFTTTESSNNIAFTLSNVSPFTVYSRGSGTGVPSFQTGLDSNYLATGFHTENYYNAKYLTSLAGAWLLASGGTLTGNNTLTGAGFYTKFSGGRLEAGQGAAVSSANNLTLGNDGNTFSITGATQINAITTSNWQAGSEVHLIFASTPTVKNNTAGGAGTAVILLAGAADFTAAANDVLSLLYDGTNWHETSRKLSGTTGGGTVTSIATTSPITGGTITNTGTIGIQPATSSQNGYASTNQIIGTIGDSENGQGNVISTGSKGFITIPYNCTITNWYVASDVTGSVQFDVKRSGTSIIGGGGNKPALSAASSNNAAVSGWTSTSVTAGDILEFYCDNATTITRVTVILKVIK